MRGNPSQWTVGSAWIGVGGLYPGAGESIGLAGTSPENADGGLYDDGGGVGDPPFDGYQNEMYNDSMGAGMGSGGAGAGMFDGGGGGGDDMAPDWFNGHILAGAFAAIFLGGLTFFIHHRATSGQTGHSPIRWTIGEVALVTVAAAAGTPLLKSGVTWVGSQFPIAAPLADYVNAGS